MSAFSNKSFSHYRCVEAALPFSAVAQRLRIGGFIMEVKKQIEQELSDIILPEHFVNNVLYAARNKRRKRGLQAAVIILCVMLTGGTAGAGYFLYNNIYVNKEVLPALEPMKKRL